MFACCLTSHDPDREIRDHARRRGLLPNHRDRLARPILAARFSKKPRSFCANIKFEPKSIAFGPPGAANLTARGHHGEGCQRERAGVLFTDIRRAYYLPLQYVNARRDPDLDADAVSSWLG